MSNAAPKMPQSSSRPANQKWRGINQTGDTARRRIFIYKNMSHRIIATFMHSRTPPQISVITRELRAQRNFSPFIVDFARTRYRRSSKTAAFLLMLPCCRNRTSGLFFINVRREIDSTSTRWHGKLALTVFHCITDLTVFRGHFFAINHYCVDL